MDGPLGNFSIRIEKKDATAKNVYQFAIKIRKKMVFFETILIHKIQTINQSLLRQQILSYKSRPFLLCKNRKYQMTIGFIVNSIVVKRFKQ